jgi:Domain of unknown function (DUF5655)
VSVLRTHPDDAGQGAGTALTAEAEQLISGQYADRPQLRPVLDAVLALLPALGPVTVQARRTQVSLVCPRRTFAWVQPTTKHRVDLGLRLAAAGPAGPAGLRACYGPPGTLVRPRCGSRCRSPATSTTRCSAGCGAPTMRTPPRLPRAVPPGARRQSSGR